MGDKRRRLWRGFGFVAGASLLLAACGGGAGGSSSPGGSSAAGDTNAPSSAAECGTVNLAVNPWVGYEANAAVIGYLAENELGCTVEYKDLKEEISWQGFETGEVDAVLENWGHPDLVKTYIDEKKVAQDAGPTGNEGVIGWFVPKFFADANPDILTADKDPKVLNKYADLFKTSESGDKGQLLDGDPSYVTNDEALVANLGLDYKVIYSGSEAASNKAIQAAIDQKKPILAYYYTPNWFSAVVDLVHVPLPPYTDGCDADPKTVACDYPPYHLNKIVSTSFAESGSPAYNLIKNFNWTNEDQDLVASYIANDAMSREDAAKKWIDANKDKWQAWLSQ